MHQAFLRRLMGMLALLSASSALAENSLQTLQWEVIENRDVMHNQVTRKLFGVATFPDGLEIEVEGTCKDYGFFFSISTFRDQKAADFPLVELTRGTPSAHVSLKIDAGPIRTIYADRPYRNSVKIGFAEPEHMRAYFNRLFSNSGVSFLNSMQRRQIDEMLPTAMNKIAGGHIAALDQATSVWVELPLDDGTQNVLELNPRDSALQPYIRQCAAWLGVRAVEPPRPQNSTPITAPQAVAASPTSADDLSTKVRDFLDRYHRAAATDMRQLSKFYAESVDYGRKGMTSREVVMREKMEVAQICPERAYRVLEDSVRIQPSGEGRVDVDFNVDTLCQGGAHDTHRVWQSFLSLNFIGGTPVIVAQRGSAKPAD